VSTNGVQSICTLVTSVLPTVPLPLDTVQVCAVLLGSVGEELTETE
jgi:hypothetical protein